MKIKIDKNKEGKYVITEFKGNKLSNVSGTYTKTQIAKWIKEHLD